MSNFEDITIKGVGSTRVGFTSQEEYPWYLVSVTLSRMPDKKWEDCFNEVFQQSDERLLDEYKQLVDREREDIPDKTRHLIKMELEAIFGPEEDEVELFKDAVPLIGRYELHGEKLVLLRRDSKDGTEAEQKSLPDVKALLDAVNNCRRSKP